MRLAQLARKVEKKQDEIVKFLESKFEIKLDKDPNLKLEDDHIDAVIAEFEIPVVEAPKVEVKVEEKVEEEIIAPVEEKEVETPEVSEEIENETPVAENETEEVDQSITEELAKEETTSETATEDSENDELDPFTERKVDPDAELIKAPKVQLEGFKVVGKIELPETSKEEEIVEEEVSEANDATDTPIEGEALVQEGEGVIDELEASMQAANQDIKEGKPVVAAEVSENVEEEEQEESIYKDARGIYHFTQEQKDNRRKFYAAKKEKDRLEREKEKKRRHYEELMAARQKASVKDVKVKNLKKKAKKEENQAPKKEKPTTLWGRFLYWLND